MDVNRFKWLYDQKIKFGQLLIKRIKLNQLQMKYFANILGICFCLTVSCTTRSNHLLSQKAQIATIGFYNLENLFDTEDDPKINDEEFLPQGPRAWTEEKYRDKLTRLSTVLEALGTELNPDGVAVLGVSEIENRKVLEDLVQTEKLAQRKYKIVHFDSKDARGIDVALLYQSKYFTVLGAETVFVPIYDENGNIKYTRDVLLVRGKLKDQIIYVTVNHWPSRRGGEAFTEPFRMLAAEINKHIADSIAQVEPDASFIVMGDLNDNPDNKSMTVSLHAKKDQEELQSGDFYNPFFKNFSQGEGTLAHDDSWSLFDQIVFSKNLLNKDKGRFYFYKNQIYRKDFMIETTGHYKNYPKRTFSGNTYNYGYSDHFPVLIYLAKEID